MPLSLILVLTSVQWLSASGGKAAVSNFGGTAVSVVDQAGEVVFCLQGETGEVFSHLRFRDAGLACLSSIRGLIETNVQTGEVSIVSPAGTGAPWIDSSGDIWFTRDGFLFRCGEMAGANIEAFHVSVESGTAVFTDDDDFLRIRDLQTGNERILRGYRFYAPAALPGGGVVSPALTGEIIYVDPDGGIMVAAYGEQPCWSSRLQGIFYTVTADDGHRLTAADLWFVRPGENPVRITDTGEAMEVNPQYSGGFLWYSDAVNGSIGVLDADALSL